MNISIRKCIQTHQCMMCLFCVIISFITVVPFKVFAQSTNYPLPKNALHESLPGDGLKRFDFFYAGEAKARKMYIVKKGKITWSYVDTTGKGEISDASLMANGNVLFAHQYGVTLIDRDKKVLWNYDAPEGFETHTAEMIGMDHVLFVQNGNPAKVIVINIHTSRVVKEFTLPFKSSTHGQIRHARLTKEGTLLVAHMDLGRVSEYDSEGKELRSFNVPGVWSAAPLDNGNILVASNNSFVQEIDGNGEIVWNCQLKNLKDFPINNPQLAVRLQDGNTLINNWSDEWKISNLNTQPIQAIIITPDKKVVWALSSWTGATNLGPSTTIQIINGADGKFKTYHFGNIR